MEGLQVFVRVAGMVPVLPGILTILAARHLWLRLADIRGWSLRLVCVGAGVFWPVALYLQELAFQHCNPADLSCGGELGGVIMWLAVWGNGLIGLVSGWFLGRLSGTGHGTAGRGARPLG